MQHERLPHSSQISVITPPVRCWRSLTEPLSEPCAPPHPGPPQEERGGPRPRLCHVKKGAGGYGFNLHSEKTKPGQFIRAVDQDSPAQRAGVRPRDKLVQVRPPLPQILTLE